MQSQPKTMIQGTPSEHIQPVTAPVRTGFAPSNHTIRLEPGAAMRLQPPTEMPPLPTSPFSEPPDSEVSYSGRAEEVDFVNWFVHAVLKAERPLTGEDLLNQLSRVTIIPDRCTNIIYFHPEAKHVPITLIRCDKRDFAVYEPDPRLKPRVGITAHPLMDRDTMLGIFQMPPIDYAPQIEKERICVISLVQPQRAENISRRYTAVWWQNKGKAPTHEDDSPHKIVNGSHPFILFDPIIAGSPKVSIMHAMNRPTLVTLNYHSPTL